VIHLLYEDLALCLISSVRYALGRRTYIVSATCQLVKKYHKFLNARDVGVMMWDIIRQEQMGYGDDCDREEWVRLLDVLSPLPREEDPDESTIWRGKTVELGGKRRLYLEEDEETMERSTE
jgi:hypothetical protein